MKTCLFVASLIALLLNSCESACENKIAPSFALTNTTADYTLLVAPKCDALFTLKGSVTAKSQQTGQVDASVRIEGSDCTVTTATGTGADKVSVTKEPSGACTVRVPLMWVSGLQNEPAELNLNAQIVNAKDPTHARCNYKGPTPGTNLGQPFSVNKSCDQLGG